MEGKQSPQARASEKVPVARRPKNLKIIMSNILVNVAVCIVQCLIFNFLPTFSKNLLYTRAMS